MNYQIENYTDGWAYVYERKEKGNRTIESLDELKFIEKISFNEKNARNEDLLFADSNGHSLNKKIKISFVKFVKEKQYIKILNILYYLYRLDIDSKSNEMYLYLESLRNLNEG